MSCLSSLEQQDDVWEFVGTLPLPDEEHPHHLFAIMEGQASVGVAGLVDRKHSTQRFRAALCLEIRGAGAGLRSKPASSS